VISDRGWTNPFHLPNAFTDEGLKKTRREKVARESWRVSSRKKAIKDQYIARCNIISLEDSRELFKS